MARRSDVAPAWCDLHGTCIGKRNGVRSARQVQGAVRRRGVLRFPRSVSNGARARSANERGVAARACDPRTPKVQHCQNCQTSRTLALERKRPVKPTEVFKVFKGKVGVPKLGNVPTQTVCASNACAFLSICCALLMFCQNRIGGHTRMHKTFMGVCRSTTRLGSPCKIEAPRPFFQESHLKTKCLWKSGRT